MGRGGEGGAEAAVATAAGKVRRTVWVHAAGRADLGVRRGRVLLAGQGRQRAARRDAALPGHGVHDGQDEDRRCAAGGGRAADRGSAEDRGEGGAVGGGCEWAVRSRDGDNVWRGAGAVWAAVV